MLRRVESLGYIETAQRLKTLAGQILRFAISAGYLETDPTAALKGALMSPEKKHFAAMTSPEDVGMLFRLVLAYPYPVVRACLLLQLLTAVRPGEARMAEWGEFSGDRWTIPAERMKTRRPHIVPLAAQALVVLEELRSFTGAGKWLFPSPRNDGRCMSENGVRVALRSMGFGADQITPHGFRAMASTTLNENGWSPDTIERQLAHMERNQVRAAYNHAEYLEERRKMMQWWADWLEGLAASSS